MLLFEVDPEVDHVSAGQYTTVAATVPALAREALIKSRMRDRGDLGRGQVGEDAV